jgi:hypothetical protein
VTQAKLSKCLHFLAAYGLFLPSSEGPCAQRAHSVCHARVQRSREAACKATGHGQCGCLRSIPMHIKLSTSRKLLWHYRVATLTIMLANKELPYDDNTTCGPAYA